MRYALLLLALSGCGKMVIQEDGGEPVDGGADLTRVPDLAPYFGKSCQSHADCGYAFVCMGQWGDAWGYCSLYCGVSGNNTCNEGSACTAIVRNPAAPVTDGGKYDENTDAGDAYIWICAK